MKQSQVKAVRKYDKTFKYESVHNWLSSGKSASVVAEELGIHPDRLYAWKKEVVGEESVGKRAISGKPRTLTEALKRYEADQREIQHLRQQRDILKKTLGILSEPSKNDTNGLMR